MGIRSLLLAVALFAALSSSAQQYSITPSRGPVAGGTEVTIKGSFGTWPYSVIFGSAHVPATRIDGTTIVATAPPHLPGTVSITIFEYDFGIPTNLKFTYEGDVSGTFERLLLPVFMPTIHGAFGSEFRTDLTARLAVESSADLYGLWASCPVNPSLCIYPEDEPLTLTTETPQMPTVNRTGTPGTYVYLPKEHANRVAMNLRAYDVSRSAENFGTELPIVRAREFAVGYEPITLVGIPSDSRFRNTLRIYGYGDTGATLIVTIEGDDVEMVRIVELAPNRGNYHPRYVEIGGFPVDAGMLRVRIDVDVPPISAPLPPPDRWAFVSVTNNETQHITLVTPQPRL